MLCVLCASVVIYSNVSHAQSDSSKYLITVLVETKTDTIWRLSNPESTVPHYILDEKKLQQFGVRDVGEAINYVPGVQLKDYGGIGGIKTISFRSLGSNHTGVILDGVKIPNVQTGSINLTPFEIFGIHEISFSSGQTEENIAPASAYLNANSISIHSSIASRPDKFSMSLYSTNTTISSYEKGVLFRIPLKQNFFIGLQGFTKFGSGEYSFKSKFDQTELIRTNSSLFTYKFRFAAGHEGQNSKTLFSAMYYSNEQELPGAMILYNPNNDQKIWNEELRLALTHDQKLGSGKIFFNSFYQSSYMRYFDPDFLNLQGFIDNEFLQENFGAGAIYKRPIKKMGFFFAGYDFIQSKLSGSTTYDPKRYENNFAGGFNWMTNKIKVESNVTFQMVKDLSNTEDSISERNFYEVSPFVSLGWKPFKAIPFHFRSFYKRAFTLPTFNDLYYNLIGNTSLKPERAHQFNVGFNTFKLFRRIYSEVSIDFFYNQIENKIVAIPTKDLFNWSMQNIGRINAMGYDAGILFHYLLDKWKMTLNVTYSYNLSLDVSDMSSTTYRKQIPYVPFHSATAAFVVARKNLVLNVNGIYTGFRYSLNENIWANYMESFTDFSVSLTGNFKIAKNLKIETTLSAMNILNKNYEVIRSFPMPGRYYQLMLKFKI